MTIQEMHIAVNLGVQKIASFQVDNLLPQEIDHELNVAMEKFIKLRYSPLGNKYRDGFEQSQKRIDDLRNLVVNARVQAFYNRESVDDNKFFVERARLPQDYLFLLNLMTKISFNCNGSADPTETTETKTYFSINLFPPQPGYVLTGIYYQDPNNPSQFGGFFIQNEDGMDYDYYSNPQNYLSITGTVPADSVQDGDSTVGVSTYTIDNNSELTPTVDSNTLLLYTKFPQYVQNGWTAVWKNPLTGQQVSVQYSGPKTVTITKRLNPILPTKRVACKYVQHDDILGLLYDPFNTTTHKYPKYTIQENFIDVYSDNKFIPIFVELTYIRHPKKLNRIDGVGCELPEHTHQEIVEMAVKSILETIESPRYQTQSMENMESE